MASTPRSARAGRVSHGLCHHGGKTQDGIARP